MNTKVKRFTFFLTLCVSIILFFSPTTVFSQIATGKHSVESPVRSTISATPKPSIFYQVARGNEVIQGSAQISFAVKASDFFEELKINTDQYFIDPDTGSLYLGYYFSVGVRSGNHNKGEQLKLLMRGNFTKGIERMFYVYGNGMINPQSERELTPLTEGFHPFASIAVNRIQCGRTYANGAVANAKIKCLTSPNVNEMDLTLFVKILPQDVDTVLTTEVAFASSFDLDGGR